MSIFPGIIHDAMYFNFSVCSAVATAVEIHETNGTKEKEILRSKRKKEEGIFNTRRGKACQGYHRYTPCLCVRLVRPYLALFTLRGLDVLFLDQVFGY